MVLGYGLCPRGAAGVDSVAFEKGSYVLPGTVATGHIELLPTAYLDGIHLVGGYGPAGSDS